MQQLAVSEEKDDTNKETVDGLDEGEVNNSLNEKDDGVIDYENMPGDSIELDDKEFLLYTELRAWRLKQSKEADIEPYKICQVSLCFLV